MAYRYETISDGEDNCSDRGVSPDEDLELERTKFNNLVVEDTTPDGHDCACRIDGCVTPTLLCTESDEAFVGLGDDIGTGDPVEEMLNDISKYIAAKNLEPIAESGAICCNEVEIEYLRRDVHVITFHDQKDGKEKSEERDAIEELWKWFHSAGIVNQVRTRVAGKCYNCSRTICYHDPNEWLGNRVPHSKWSSCHRDRCGGYGCSQGGIEERKTDNLQTTQHVRHMFIDCGICGKSDCTDDHREHVKRRGKVLYENAFGCSIQPEREETTILVRAKKIADVHLLRFEAIFPMSQDSIAYLKKRDREALLQDDEETDSVPLEAEFNLFNTME